MTTQHEVQKNKETIEPIEAAPRPAGGLKHRVWRLLPFALFILVGIMAVTPFFSRTARTPGSHETTKMLWTDDLPNHLAFSKQFDRVFRSGVVYPRWLPDINNGYGVATMIFYPPGVHYLALVFHALIGDWMNAYFAMSAIGLILSGLSFYGLARVFFGRPASTVAALFYMLAPFHLFNLYFQGAVPQFIGYAFMPSAVYFAYRLGTHGRRVIDYAGLGLVYGLYLLTHLPVSYLFTYALALYALLWAVRERNIWITVRIAAGMSLGLLLSAIYWLPAALESKYAYNWTPDYMPYHSNYLTLLESNDAVGFLINSSFWLIVAPVAIAIWTLRSRHLDGDAFESGLKYNGNFAYGQVRLWIVLAVSAICMSTALSLHVSKLIPRIDVATPPWRWLAIASLFASLTLAAAIERLLRGRLQMSLSKWAHRAAITALCAMSLWITVRYVIVDPVRTGRDYVIPAMHMDTGFTPKNSTLPDQLPNAPLTTLEPEGGTSEVIEWSPQHRVVAVKANQQSELRLKTYNFPGWTARVDGDVVPMLSDKDGSQRVDVPAGIHTVQATFENTWPCTAGSLLSGIAALGLLGLAVGSRLRLGGIQSGRDRENDADAADSKSVAASITRPKSIPLRTVAVIVAVVIAGVAVVMISSRPEDTRSRAGGPTSKPVAPASLRPGSETQLNLPSQDSVVVALDEKGLDAVVGALVSKDKTALDALVASSKALRVPNNTRVRVIEIGTGKIKVRILEGEHLMADGWVPERWLK